MTTGTKQQKLKAFAIKLKRIPLVCLTLAMISCGGGGGGSESSSGNTTSNEETPNSTTTVTLNWSAPTQRLDGSDLSADEISGYVIIFFTESELSSQTLASSLTSLPSAAEFTSNPSINNYINSYELSSLIETGSPYAILVSPGSSESYELENLDSDTYYFAISAFDLDNNYSELSETTSFDIAGS